MALQALRSALNRSGGDSATRPGGSDAPADPLVSGGTDGEMFPCPACGRTIPRGTRRCEGCGQRLLLDVQARKASMLVGAGVLAGFVVGGLLVGVAVPRPAGAAAASAQPTLAPGAPTPVPPDAAAAALAALRGTTVLNGRLAAQADPLAQALAAKRIAVDDVVRVLRQMGSDTRAAAAMVPSLGVLSQAQAHQAALSAFYTDLSAELDTGLAASVTSSGAYRATAKRVIALLKQIPDLDAEARSIGTELGAELPAITLPDVLTGG